MEPSRLWITHTRPVLLRVRQVLSAYALRRELLRELARVVEAQLSARGDHAEPLEEKRIHGLYPVGPGVLGHDPGQVAVVFHETLRVRVHDEDARRAPFEPERVGSERALESFGKHESLPSARGALYEEVGVQAYLGDRALLLLAQAGYPLPLRFEVELLFAQTVHPLVFSRGQGFQLGEPELETFLFRREPLRGLCRGIVLGESSGHLGVFFRFFVEAEAERGELAAQLVGTALLVPLTQALFQLPHGGRAFEAREAGERAEELHGAPRLFGVQRAELVADAVDQLSLAPCRPLAL